jgi:hypothetical protein
MLWLWTLLNMSDTPQQAERRVERNLRRLTGLSQSQIRESLWAAAKARQDQAVLRQFEQQQPQPVPQPPPALPVVEQKFEPRPFGLGETGEQAPKVVPNVNSLQLVTATIAVAGTESVPSGGLYRTFTVALAVPDGTPLMVDTGAQPWPIQFVGSYVNGGTAFIQFWSDTPTTCSAGTITINAVIPLN